MARLISAPRIDPGRPMPAENRARIRVLRGVATLPARARAWIARALRRRARPETDHEPAKGQD